MSKHTRTHHRRGHKRSSKKHTKTHRRHARGGFLAKAIVPFSLFGLQHYFSKKHRRHGNKTHRKSRKGGAYSMIKKTCANPNKRYSNTKKGCVPRKCAPGQIVSRNPITDMFECVTSPLA